MKINVKDTEKLQAAIDAVQGPRVSARTITAEGITRTTCNLEKRLSEILLKKDWRGARFSVDVCAQTFPSSYKGRPESTQFRLERGLRDWFLVSIGRGGCRGPESRIIPTFTDGQKAAMVEFLSDSKNW